MNNSSQLTLNSLNSLNLTIELRSQLKLTLRRIVASVRGQKLAHKKLPDATVKHGKLKTDRKSRHQAVLVEDLAALENLNEDIIVGQLQKRFLLGQIYTYIGDILIAVNPFKTLDLYGEQHSQMYRDRPKSENPPHIYGNLSPLCSCPSI